MFDHCFLIEIYPFHHTVSHASFCFQSKFPKCGMIPCIRLVIIISVLRILFSYLQIISLRSLFPYTKFSLIPHKCLLLSKRVLFNLCFPQCCLCYLLFLMVILLGMVVWLPSIHFTNASPCRRHEVCVSGWLFSQFQGWNLSEPRQAVKCYALGLTGWRLDTQSDCFPQTQAKLWRGNSSFWTVFRVWEFKYATAASILPPWKKLSPDQNQPDKERNSEREAGKAHRSSDPALPGAWSIWTFKLNEAIYFLKG